MGVDSEIYPGQQEIVFPRMRGFSNSCPVLLAGRVLPSDGF